MLVNLCTLRTPGYVGFDSSSLKKLVTTLVVALLILALLCARCKENSTPRLASHAHPTIDMSFTPTFTLFHYTRYSASNSSKSKNSRKLIRLVTSTRFLHWLINYAIIFNFSSSTTVLCNRSSRIRSKSNAISQISLYAHIILTSRA